MNDYKLKELEYVDGGFRVRFAPVDNDIEFFISDKEGIESLFYYASHPDEPLQIHVDEDACLKEPKILFGRGRVRSNWYPCRWLRRIVDE